MNTIKWELEDLAFATLHPKIYDEIVRLVAERAPSRDQFLAEVVDQVEADLQEAKIKARYRPAQALLLDLPEDDRRRPRVLRHLRPGRHPGPGRGGPRLLRASRRAAHAVEPGARPVQGLHRDAEVQHVPVAAHHGHRPAGQAGGDPDPHLAMHRRAEYGVAAHWKYKEDGRTRRHRPAAATSTTWRGCASCSTGRARSRTRASSSSRCASRSPGRGLRLHAEGDVIALPRVDAGGLRLRRHTEVGHRCIGARVNGRLVALESTLENGDVVEVFTSKAPNAGPSRDWLGFVKSPRARSKIRQWFTKERREEAIEPRQGADRQADAQGGPAPQAAAVPRVADPGRRALQLADVSALYAAVGEGNLAPRPSYARVVELHGGDRGGGGGHRRGRRSPGRGAPSPEAATPGSWSGASGTSGSSSPVLHARAPATHPRLRHHGRRGLGAPATAPSRAPARASPIGWSRSSGRRQRSRCSCAIQVEALDRPDCCRTSPGCSRTPT